MINTSYTLYYICQYQSEQYCHLRLKLDLDILCNEVNRDTNKHDTATERCSAAQETAHPSSFIGASWIQPTHLASCTSHTQLSVSSLLWVRLATLECEVTVILLQSSVATLSSAGDQLYSPVRKATEVSLHDGAQPSNCGSAGVSGVVPLMWGSYSSYASEISMNWVT